MFFYRKNSAFTLVEVLMAMAILGLLAGVGAVYLGNYLRSHQLVEQSKRITDYLKNVQIKSQNQELGTGWSVHFENPIGKQRVWYGFFQGSAYQGNASETNYLSDQIDFISPSDGTTTDIVFQAPGGGAAQDATITIGLTGGSISDQRSIFIKTTGLVYHN